MPRKAPRLPPASRGLPRCNPLGPAMMLLTATSARHPLGTNDLGHRHMTASQYTRFASPVTLLREWSERADRADLHEALFMGFSVDLPALERDAVSLARGLSARVAVFEDAARGHYDPVDVRGAGRDYLYAPTVGRAAFRPKLALLLGAHACRVAIGSGNPATADW